MIAMMTPITPPKRGFPLELLSCVSAGFLLTVVVVDVAIVVNCVVCVDVVVVTVLVAVLFSL